VVGKDKLKQAFSHLLTEDALELYEGLLHVRDAIEKYVPLSVSEGKDKDGAERVRLVRKECLKTINTLIDALYEGNVKDNIFYMVFNPTNTVITDPTRVFGVGWGTSVDYWCAERIPLLTDDGIIYLYRVDEYEEVDDSPPKIILKTSAGTNMVNKNIVSRGLRILTLLSGTNYSKKLFDNVDKFTAPGRPLVVFLNGYFLAVAPIVVTEEGGMDEKS